MTRAYVPDDAQFLRVPALRADAVRVLERDAGLRLAHHLREQTALTHPQRVLRAHVECVVGPGTQSNLQKTTTTVQHSLQSYASWQYVQYSNAGWTISIVVCVLLTMLNLRL